MNTGQKTLTLTALLLILIIIPTAHATTTTLTGSIITQETGQPIPDAEITVLYRQYRRRWYTGWYTHSTTTTNQQGQYTLNLETDTNYLILVTHKQDQKHTHIPIGIYHTSTNQTQTKNIQLQKTATIKLKGLAYFIETTAIPENTFRVTEPGTNEAIEYGDLNLVYGLGTGSITTLLQLPTDQIYVPTEQPLEINVQSYTSTHGDNLQKTLTLNQAPLIPGEATEIDLRAHILPQGIQTLQNKTRTLQTLINQKEKEGFYLAVERQQINQIQRLTNDATSLTNQGRFSEAFAKCRETYIQIQDLENGLNNLITDARRSVYILVAFTTITSIITATMLHEDHTRKIATSAIIFTLLLISLHILHPGAQITRTRDLVKNSAIIYTTLTITTITLPRLLNTQSKGKDVSLLNMTVPILSIAKRSLRRRRLRFILTLTSVLLLVASFISLTSFTSGYGLSHTRVSTTAKPEGVMIRTPDPPPTRAAPPFSGGTGAAGPLPLDESLIGWYTQIDEIIEASPRYENYPQRQYRESYY